MNRRVIAALLMLGAAGPAAAGEPGLTPLAGHAPGLRTLAPRPPAPSSLDSELRGLELDWRTDDVQRDQRRRVAERRLRERGELRSLDDYQARERRADDTRELGEQLDRQALEGRHPGVRVAPDPVRENELVREELELEQRTDSLERQIRPRDALTP